MLVHDEAHLEPAFQALIEEVRREQSHFPWERDRFAVTALSATARTGTSSFSLTASDLENDVVRKRFYAKKGLRMHPLAEGKKLPDALAELARNPDFDGQAVVVFMRRVKDVEAVRAALDGSPSSTAVLTGTLRGFERDQLAQTNGVFARFMPPHDRDPRCTPQSGTVFLISTSAGEVGVNLSADHLVCDLAPFDSMVQRFGRVNRFGHGKASIDIVVDESAARGDDMFASSIQKTRALLARLPRVGTFRAARCEPRSSG